VARTIEADPELVAEELDFLTNATEDEFARELTEYVMARRPEQAVAFRSPALVRRTAKTADRLLKHHGPLVRQTKVESGNAYQKRAERTRHAMALELRLAQTIIAGDDARNGRISRTPNPSNRARLRLAEEYPVRYLALKREEEATAKRAGRR